MESDQYTFNDFVEIVTSLRVCDNVDFISTRLFHRVVADADAAADERDTATRALRSGLRLVWAKAGEIVCSQGQRMDDLVVVYHGSATGVRLTSSGHQQRLVSLAPGQVFGFFEMIMDQPTLLTLTMDADGTVMVRSLLWLVATVSLVVRHPSDVTTGAVQAAPSRRHRHAVEHKL